MSVSLVETLVEKLPLSTCKFSIPVSLVETLLSTEDDKVLIVFFKELLTVCSSTSVAYVLSRELLKDSKLEVLL